MDPQRSWSGPGGTDELRPVSDGRVGDQMSNRRLAVSHSTHDRRERQRLTETPPDCRVQVKIGGWASEAPDERGERNPTVPGIETTKLRACDLSMAELLHCRRWRPSTWDCCSLGRRSNGRGHIAIIAPPMVFARLSTDFSAAGPPCINGSAAEMGKASRRPYNGDGA